MKPTSPCTLYKLVVFVLLNKVVGFLWIFVNFPFEAVPTFHTFSISSKGRWGVLLEDVGF